MKASDLIIKCLEEEGVSRIFGVPGEENADFMMSLKKSKKIKEIVTSMQEYSKKWKYSYNIWTIYAQYWHNNLIIVSKNFFAKFIA